MTLGELIKRLEQEPADKSVPMGFTDPHSYRGNYYDLAFEPDADTTVGAMLKAARWAVGKRFHGYKGGEYGMDEHSDVWLAQHGETGERIGPVLLDYMLGKYQD